MRRRIRDLAVTGFVLAALALAAAPARASCAMQTQADQIARADVVAYGRVTAVDRGAGTFSFRAFNVYKGDPGPQTLAVRIGPGGGAVTSVDYRADPGDHLLYLQRPGSVYETNDCSGSHPGPATADELRLLATGRVITYSTAADPAPDVLGRITGPLAAALVAVVVAAFVVYRGRRKPA